MLEQSPRRAVLAPAAPARPESGPPDAAVIVPAPMGSAGDDAGYAKRRLGLGFWLAAGWTVLLVALALLAPVLTSKGWLQDPDQSDTARLFSMSTASHWLGTDSLGRDQLARIVWGARVSLPVGFASISLGLLAGTTIGLVSGYLKGWVDTTLMTLMDIVLAFPALLLALSIVTFTDAKDVGHISAAIGIISIPAIARLVRANTLTFREREFVLAARALGATHGRILVREVLPNVVPPVVSFAVIGVAVAIAAEAALAFIGVSVPLPTATWGGMINEARGTLDVHPYQVFVPCAVLVVTIIALYFIGDRLGQYFHVKESSL